MDLFGFLGGLIGDIGGELDAVVTWATGNFNALWDNQGGILGVLGNFIGWVWGAVSSIVRFLSGLWDWLRNHLLNKIVDWIHRHWQALKNWLAPLIRWIDAERQLLYKLWYTYVRPIINFIQALRRMLFIFRLLGFKWAAQLDAYLVKLENKINAAFLGAWENLNILADWINYILDPFGLLNSWVLLGGIFNSISAIWAMIVGLPGLSNAPPSIQVFDTPAGYFDAPTVAARLAVRFQGGFLPEDQVILNALHQDASLMGYPPPAFA